jgi:hypothetical protein
VACTLSSVSYECSGRRLTTEQSKRCFLRRRGFHSERTFLARVCYRGSLISLGRLSGVAGVAQTERQKLRRRPLPAPASLVVADACVNSARRSNC